MALSCLSNLVGLTNKLDCACFDADLPDEFASLNATDTGHYIIDDDDLDAPVLNAILSANDCEDGTNLWTTLENARSGALKAFETDFSAQLRGLYSKTFEGFTEEVGERSASQVLTSSSTYVGMQLTPGRFKDLKYVIKNIYLGLNTTMDVDLTIQSTNPDYVTTTVPLSAVANTWSKNVLATEIEIPFWGRARVTDNKGSGDRYRYNFSYPLGGAKYMDNKYDCGCSGSKPRWSKFMTPGAFEMDSLDNIGFHSTGRPKGLVLDGYITCDDLKWLCELDTIGGYYLRDVMAWAVKYKAISLLTTHILQSGKINFYTLMSREALYGTRNRMEKLYNERLLWLAQKLPSDATGCYQCQPGYYSRASL